MSVVSLNRYCMNSRSVCSHDILKGRGKDLKRRSHHLALRLWSTLASLRYVRLLISSQRSNLGGFTWWIFLAGFFDINKRSRKFVHHTKNRRLDVKVQTDICTVFLNSLALLNLALRNAVRKKTGFCGRNSQTGGGGSDPNPLLDVYLPSYFWHAKMILRC